MTNTTSAPVSVVIPAHNAERFIQQAIESVHAQTVGVRELIVVADDCSDTTEKVAKSLHATVLQANFRNISAARNLGIRSTTYEWVALLDADDFWKENKIESQWKAKQFFPEAGVISCDCYVLSDEGISKPSHRELRERRSHVSCPPIVTQQGTYFPKVDGSVLRWFEVPPQAAMIRRDVFETAGFFDESFLYLQDLEFFARALKDHSLVVIEEPLVYRRIRRDSHSANADGKWTSYLAMVNRMLRHRDQYAPRAGEEYREHIKRVFAQNERVFAEKRNSRTASVPVLS